MIAPRWRKILRDLWNNRGRSLLVVLSIAVGVFAIGTILSARATLDEQLPGQYAAVQPGNAIITTDRFEDDLVDSIRNVDGVQEAEGRRSLAVRTSLSPEGKNWQDLTLFVLSDWDDSRLFKVRPQSGDWPPAQRTLLLERASLEYLGLHEGDQILIKTPAGRQRTLRISGTAYDLYRVPPALEGWVYGYVTMDTLQWLGEESGFNELYIQVTGQDFSSARVQPIIDRVGDHVEDTGRVVYQKVQVDPRKLPLDYIINTILLLLGALGALSLGLSGFLVINTISALMAQQVRQIGVMKAVGARAGQIAGVYLGMVLILGLLASIIAIPASLLGAQFLSSLVMSFLNYTPADSGYPLQALFIQLAVGLLVPLAAALSPVLSGARVPPALALSEYGASKIWTGSGLFKRLLWGQRGLARPLLLSLRNPFRRRGRLLLSLLTLTLAGSIFIAIFSLQDSLNATLNEMLGFWKYDLWITLDRSYNLERIQAEARQVPGVERAEGWGYTSARRVRPDGSEGSNLYVFAPPADSAMIDPPIVEGRWLRPDDRNAVVISPSLLNREPDLKLGGQMVMKIDGREVPFHIVGVIRMLGNETIGYVIYVNRPYFSEVVKESNRVNSLIVSTTRSDLAYQRAVTDALESRLDRQGVEVISILQTGGEREEINSAFSIIMGLLLFMAMLLALVGGLGLMGTMSLNVIDRTREIGVMRAFGASNRSVFRVFIQEGMLIGVMSWVFASLLALPFSQIFSQTIGLSFMDSPLVYTYSLTGMLLWLGMVILLSALASFLPAWNAVRLTVREVLAYE